MDRETLDGEREGPGVECRVVEPSERVEWTDVRNLATTDIRKAARQMAATTQYAGELKRLAGGSQAGRPLAKPVYHYTLSWGQDERPARAEMSRAVDESLRALGMKDRQALVVAHNDTRHPHVHVVVNRVSAENGRAATRGNDRLKLSRWAERWEREHGREGRELEEVAARKNREAMESPIRSADLDPRAIADELARMETELPEAGRAAFRQQVQGSPGRVTLNIDR